MKKQTVNSFKLIVFVALSSLSCNQSTESPKPIDVNPPPQQNPNNPNQPITQLATLQKAVYSDLDFQEFEYDSQSRLTKFISQWQFVQSDPTKIIKIENNFFYDSNGLLTKAKSKNEEFRYLYKDGKLEKVELLNSKKQVLSTYLLKFDNKDRLTEKTEVYSDLIRNNHNSEKVRDEYFYDAAGNCVKIINSYWKNAQFIVYETIQFEEFDKAPNPFNSVARIPFLPNFSFQKNNPKTEIITFENGFRQTIKYQFKYDNKGTPTERKALRENGGVVTLKLVYNK